MKVQGWTMVNFYKKLWHELKISYHRMSRHNSKVDSHNEFIHEAFGMLALLIIGAMPFTLLTLLIGAVI